jgi:hypothetical protein
MHIPSTVQLQRHQLKVVYLPIADLSGYENNARVHSKAQIRKIAASIREFGFTNLIEPSLLAMGGWRPRSS